MNEILYIDLYFLVNFAMDLISLGVASLASSEKVKFRRLIFAAVLGGVFACLCTLFSLPPYFSFFLGFASLFLMVLFAFGWRGKRMVKILLFFLCTALFLGGTVEALSYYMGKTGSITPGVFLFLVFSSFGIFQLFARRLNQKLETAVVPLSVRYGEKNECFYGLVDSGLLLKDPEMGFPVLIMKAQYASPLLSQEFLERMKEGGEGSIAVPVKTASGKGVLYAFRPDGVKILGGGKRKKYKEEREVLIALDFTSGGFGGCPCLVPLSVI